MNDIIIVRKGSQKSLGARRFYCGRGSPLGNPHVMKNKTIEERNRVCDLYEYEFGSNSQLVACREIANALYDGPVELECYCAPLRCHCETIAKYIRGRT